MHVACKVLAVASAAVGNDYLRELGGLQVSRKKVGEPSVLFLKEQICWLTYHIINNLDIIQAKGFLHCRQVP